MLWKRGIVSEPPLVPAGDRAGVPETIEAALRPPHPPIHTQRTEPDTGRGTGALLVGRPAVLPRGLVPCTGMLLGVGSMWNLPEGKGSATVP